MRLRVILTLAAVWAAIGAADAAPVLYSGGTYSQNFNGLPEQTEFVLPSAVIPGRGPHDIMGHAGMTTTGMEGWTISNPVELGSTGTDAVNVEYRAHKGDQSGGNGRGVVSFGADNSMERALGELPTSGQVNRFGVALTNNTATTYKSIALSFTGEQWRRGDVAAPVAGQNALKYDVAVTGNAADNIDTAGIFTNIGSVSSPITVAPNNTALDGNLPVNQVPVAAVKNVNWAPGQILMLRWSAFQSTGQDDGLGIDSLSLSASTIAVPEPAAVALAAFALVGVALVRRRTSTK